MSVLRRITNLFSRSRVDQETEAELRSHIEMRIEDNIAAGMSPEEARRHALLRFGNPVATRERVAAMDMSLALDRVWRDIRYAWRQLLKHPGFTVTAITTLALGIGANVVVFSVLNGLILRPLNVPDPQSLYNVEHKTHGSYFQSYPDYLDYRERNHTFSEIAAYDTTRAAITTGTTTTRNFGYLTSGNYFDMLRVQPALGRFFHLSDEHGVNSAPYVVLSYDFWHTRFNGDPNVIGERIDLNQQPFTVIGVATRQFHGTEIFFWPDFWIPMVNAPQIGFSRHYLENRSTHNPWILGRLMSGVTPQQATDDLSAISAQLAKQYPTSDDDLTARLVKPGLMGDSWGDPIRSFLAGIMVLASLVLLAACANLGSIFAVRAADRNRELAIRLSMGSSRWNILRGLLTEAVIVSFFGGIAGTLFAAGLLHTLSRWQPFGEFPIHVTVLPDVKVYAIALLLSLGSGTLFGLLPARQIQRSDTAQVLKNGGNAVTSFRGFDLRDVLLCVQIALCTLLVTASLVALRGMERSLHAPIGFQPESVMLAGTDLTMAGYVEDQFLPVQKRMLEAASRLPGLSAVGIIDRTLLGSGCCGSMGVYREGTTEFRSSDQVFDGRNFSISPGYLQAAGTRLLSGRNFTWHDDDKSPRVALVNAAFGRMMFGTAHAVGRRFLLHGDTDPIEIVGVVEDGKYQSLTEDAQPAMFFPLTQQINSNETVLVVRSSLPPSAMAATLDQALTSVDRNIPFMLHSWQDALDLALFPARAATAALGIMGLLAAMLAVTGIFGMAAYSVSRRMKELGIRVAMGAERVQLMRSALGRPLILLLSGSVAGLVLGVLASRLLAQIVYEATPRDPLVLGGVILTMGVLGLAATWIPARHALSVDPARLLRDE
jgi:predicted permease